MASVGSGSSSSTISLPASLALMRRRSSSVKVSWYCSGCQSPASASMRLVAIFRALASGLARRLGRPSTFERGTTSSAKRMVDMASAVSSGRMAARYCLFRMTTVPIATRSRSSMAASRSW